MQLNLNESAIAFVHTVDPECESFIGWRLLLNFDGGSSAEDLVGDLDFEDRIFHGFEFLGCFIEFTTSDSNFKVSDFSLPLFYGSKITPLTRGTTHVWY
jgi:hypothetical protein